MLLYVLVIKFNYHAIISATCELIWFKDLLLELGFSSSVSMSLFCNNVDCYFILHHIIRPNYIYRQPNIADVFTKILTSAYIHCQLSKLESIKSL